MYSHIYLKISADGSVITDVCEEEDNVECIKINVKIVIGIKINDNTNLVKKFGKNRVRRSITKSKPDDI